MSTSYNAQYWINKLELTQHIEGGAFKEVYRSSLTLPHAALAPGHNGARAASTSIYFLLEYGDFSAFHRIASDELWHFYDGSTLSIYEITPEGRLIHHLLGKDVETGARLQVLIPAGSWFASCVEQPGEYTLCGCTVSPGFDFADFELADKRILSAQFPAHRAIISRFCR